MLAIPDLDFSGYLQSIKTHYEQWRYTPTDATGREKLKQAKQASPFNFGLMVQVRQEEQESFVRQFEEKQTEEKIERLPVLEGIRKYALDPTVRQVLLMGRPGSGKSTALARLLLEEADLPAGKIPVLVELRYWQESLIELICGAFQQHGLTISQSELDGLLSQNGLLLLFDGVNELPSEQARSQLTAFRRQYSHLSMIFTTRDISLGGDLGIEKKLEMQPLTETQMQAFVRAYLPATQAEAMLRQLQERLRELGQTPLLLWMLCELFHQMEQIPENLGLVFREFTQVYERNLKQDVPIASDRDWWQPVLQQLAWVMMQGEKPTDLRVAISQQEARAKITAFLEGKVPHAADFAIKCLRDLQRHHLIQAGGRDELEFRHQLIQEYYAALALLECLPQLSDVELQCHYLNYLKWTEPIALMLAMIGSEAQALRVVKLALQVDLVLGARLAGEVKPEFQEKTVDLIKNSELPRWLKVTLLGETQSEAAVAEVLKALEDTNFYLPIRDSEAGVTKYSKAREDEKFEKAVEDENSDAHIRDIAIVALGKIGSEIVLPSLIGALEERNPAFDACFLAEEALGQMGSEKVDSLLLDLLQSSSNIKLRKRVAGALGKSRSKKAIPLLLTLLDDPDEETRLCAAYALHDIGSEEAFPGFLKALDDSDDEIFWSVTELLKEIDLEKILPLLPQSCKAANSEIRYYATFALGWLNSKDAIPTILEALKDPDSNVRERAAWALGYMGSEVVSPEIAVPTLQERLADSDMEVRLKAAISLCKFNSAAAIPTLLKFMESDDGNSIMIWDLEETLSVITSEEAIPYFLEAIEKSEVRWIAARLLGKLGSKSAIPGLFKLLEHHETNVRVSAIAALGYLGLEALPELFKALEDALPVIRINAAEALINIGSNKAIPELLKALGDADDEVRSTVVWAVGHCGSENNVPLLTRLLNKDQDSGVRMNAADALGKIKSDLAIPALLKALEDSDDYVCESAVQALGEIGSDAATSALCKALEHPVPGIRWCAANALGEIGSDLAVPTLSKALRDPEAEVRECAVEALGKIGKDAVIPALIEVVNCSDEKSYGMALHALAQIKSKTIIPELIKLAKHSNSSVRVSAVLALREHNSAEAIQTFATTIADSDRGVQQFSAEALVKAAHENTTKYLPTLMELRLTNKGQHPHQATLGIQTNCKFYNYDLYQQAQTMQAQARQQQNQTAQPSITIGSLGVLNTGSVTVKGNQIGTQQISQNPSASDDVE